ncbi:cadmium resistance transporter [Actinoplanes bogorensis]|uniref:Cadmium resistance transporter n=1 Tax=Paractinoplanes bogorensis TaxID=1610840 RepID=A0ABS5YMP2_9ACTN|nr:cadmium resistance transporter [Actinoplanes bogorensis]MBU2664576.1 cadmium resistance transporter [Actinoplanes bogorensis]
MSLGIIGQAAALFAVTNIDDILILALFFAQGAGHHHTTRNVLLGQYLGFAGILAVAVAAALGATFLPDAAVPYLGLLPLALGIRAAIQSWRHRNDDDDETETSDGAPGILAVAAVTFANGGDNIGVYVPVFAAAEATAEATAGAAGMSVYVLVFLVLVAVWVAAGRYFATRPIIAKALSRWGHILLPVVLIGIGLLILIEGGAFGL